MSTVEHAGSWIALVALFSGACAADTEPAELVDVKQANTQSPSNGSPTRLSQQALLNSVNKFIGTNVACRNNRWTAANYKGDAVFAFATQTPDAKQVSDDELAKSLSACSDALDTLGQQLLTSGEIHSFRRGNDSAGIVFRYARFFFPTERRQPQASSDKR